MENTHWLRRPWHRQVEDIKACRRVRSISHATRRHDIASVTIKKERTRSGWLRFVRYVDENHSFHMVNQHNTVLINRTNLGLSESLVVTQHCRSHGIGDVEDCHTEEICPDVRAITANTEAPNFLRQICRPHPDRRRWVRHIPHTKRGVMRHIRILP